MTNRTEQIELRAYAIWLQQGCPEGRDAEHWKQAEAEISELGEDDMTGAGDPERHVNDDPEDNNALAAVNPRKKAKV